MAHLSGLLRLRISPPPGVLEAFCLDADDGKPRWDRRLPGEFGVSIPQWGFAGSPVVLGDALLVDVGRIIALDKMTGEKIWRTDDYGPAYSTPTPFKHRGRQLIAAFPAWSYHSQS